MARYDYKVTTKTGKEYTRSSNRVYAFAVVYTAKDGRETKPDFCSRLDLADKKSTPPWCVRKDIYQVEVVKDRGPRIMDDEGEAKC